MAVTLSMQQAAWSCQHSTAWHRNRLSHFKGSPEYEDKDRIKTKVAAEENYTEKQQSTFSSFQQKGRKKVVNKTKSSEKQRGSTPNCPVLTWMYLKIICPMSNHKLKILTYISQRVRCINRTISHDRHWQQTLLDLDQEQLLCNSEGSHASVFQGPMKVWDALFSETAQMCSATCAAHSCLVKLQLV